MMEEQYFVDFKPESQRSLQIAWQKTLAGIKYTFIFAVLAAISLMLVSLFSIIFNVFHLFHIVGVLPRLSELEASPRYMLYPWFLVVWVGLFAVFLAIWWSIEPISIYRYLRQITHDENQNAYLYIPLKVSLVVDRYREIDVDQEDQAQELDLMEWAKQQQDKNVLLFGPCGSGKTEFLHVYRVNMMQLIRKMIFGQQKIPVFVSLGTYNDFLSDELVDFLRKKVPETRHLRRYLSKMASKGRLLLLCDGLNEISDSELDAVCGQLIGLMYETSNRFIITCRQIDYLEQQCIQEMVVGTEGKIACASIAPLPTNQVDPFVHRYVEQQSSVWKHDAQQILQVINRFQLFPLCTDPPSLLTLMQIIDETGIDGGHVLDSRGLLVQEYVVRKIETELKGEWSNAELTREDVLSFLSELAYFMRWASDHNEVNLTPSLKASSLDYEALAEEVLDWLITQRPQEPFVATQDVQQGLFQDSLHKRKRARLLQLALSMGFITILPRGVLSFQHQLIADYFAARYLYFLTKDFGWQTHLPLNEAFLSEATIERWREPFALWTGLVADPEALVERIAQLGQRGLRFAAPALMLSLICLGTKRHPKQEVELPAGLRQLLVEAANDRNTRRKLALVIDRCAAENGLWVYETLFPLLTTKSIEQLMVLLNKKIVPRMLFQHLEQIADDVRYNARREPLISILRHFGSQGCEDVILMAIELSQPVAQRSTQLRKAASDILGYTHDKRAVGSLMPLLQDSQAEIVEASSHALARIGPSLVLEPLIKELRHAGSRSYIPVLRIVGHFLTAQRQEFQLKNVEYLRVLEELVPVLSSSYPPEAGESACELLKRLIQSTTDETKQSREEAMALLLRQLESPDKVLGNHVVEILTEVGEFATPYLLDRLQQQPSSIACRRIVEVFSHVRDPRSLDALLLLLASSSSNEVFYQVKFALQHYARQYPECINRLIELVLNNSSDDVADRASEILGDLGDEVIEPVIVALPTIKYGRTEKLVHVLEKRRDERAIPALIELLNLPQARNDTSLTLIVIGALGEFRDERIVSTLLNFLNCPAENELLDEVVDVLSNCGEIAFKQLVAMLDVQQETKVTPRIRQALIRMKTPLDSKIFHVEEELYKIFSTCGDGQAQQIRFVFHERGFDAARVLIQHIPDPDIQVRGRVLVTLYAMSKADVIAAFVTALRRTPSELSPELLTAAMEYLTRYDESIPTLVSALRDPQSDAISTILLKFGPKLLNSDAMIVGLNDANTRRRLQDIIKKTVSLQSEEVVPQIIDLFSRIKNKNQNLLAYSALVELLAGDLAKQSIHYLIVALEEPEVVDGVADVLERLAGRFETRDMVINTLIQSLKTTKRPNGAKEVLVRLRDKAIYPIGDLIADVDTSVASAAQEILIRIGTDAFPVIWSALSDRRNAARQDAGRNILCAMPTEVIKVKLVELLSSDKAADIEMAVTLLLELIQNEARRPSGSQKIIHALLTSIEANGPEHTKLRILTLLLLWGGSNVAEFLIVTLCNYPQLDEQLAQAFLFLRKETAGKLLLDVLQDKTGNVSPSLRAQLAGVLGMIKPDLVSDHARNIADYGLVNGNGGQVKDPGQLAVSLRSLGALLVNGTWNIGTLARLREHADVGTPQRELFDVLLGDLYSPRLKVLVQQKDAETARKEAQERENRRLEGELKTLKGQLQLKEGGLQQVREKLVRTEAERDRLQNWKTAHEWIQQQHQGPRTGGSI